MERGSGHPARRKHARCVRGKQKVRLLSVRLAIDRVLPRLGDIGVHRKIVRGAVKHAIVLCSTLLSADLAALAWEGRIAHETDMRIASALTGAPFDDASSAGGTADWPRYRRAPRGGRGAAVHVAVDWVTRVMGLP